MGTSTSVRDARAGLATAARAAILAAGLNAYGRVVVDYGYPRVLPDDAILLLGARSVQEWRRTNRTRNEAATIDVHFATRRTTELEAEDAAFDLLEAVERYCRVTDPTLGGVVEECVLTGTELDGYTDPADRGAGAFCRLIATFTTRALITG